MLTKYHAQECRRKGRAYNPAKKIASIAKLPSFENLINYVTGELRDRAIQVRELRRRPVRWEDYRVVRDYILCLVMFAIPPQRPQFYHRMTIDNITLHGEMWVMKLEEHKTANTHGPAVAVLPARYYQDFKDYLEFANDIRADSTVKSLFIGKDSLREEYLTTRFHEVIYEKFRVNISLVDCRSIYVTHAAKSLEFGAMVELAELMFHTPVTQRRIYRQDDPVSRSIALADALHQSSTNRV